MPAPADAADAAPAGRAPRWRWRPATDADLPFLLRLRIAAMGPVLAADGLDPTTEEHLARIRHHFADARLVLQGEAPVGLVKLDRAATPWVLLQLQLLPAAQRRGLGTALLRTLQAAAAAAGAGIGLFVFPPSPARRLYGRLGWREIGPSDHGLEMRWGQ